MSDSDRPQRVIPILLGVITFVLVIAALRSAQTIVVPFMLALFAALIASPILLWMQGKGMPTWLSVLAIVLVMVAVVGLIGFVAGASVQDFSDRLPFYKQQFNARLDKATENMGEDAAAAAQDLFNVFDPAKAMGLAAGLLNSVGSALTNAALIVFMLVFMLLEVTGFQKKRKGARPSSWDVMDYISRVAHSVKRYLAIKTLISLATGVTAGLLVGVMRIDFAILWGLLAFLLNYVPSIGSILAAIPPVLLALIQYGPGTALIVALGYVGINAIFGNLVEPRVAGRGVGLSPLVVFLSLVFWGWVLGPVGMLLSVPLTASIKIILESGESTRWAAVLLGGAPKDEPVA
jgi:predicted PurR-regulated permease PerM